MKKVLITAALVAMTFAGSTFSALAQRGQDPVLQSAIAVRVGIIIICNVNVGGGIIIVTPRANDQVNGPNDPADGGGGGNANNVSGSGTASFQSVASQTTPVASSSYQPVTLNFSGSDPTYGTFNFSFDGSRPTTNTTVTANQGGSDFPASAHVYANVTGTVSGLPGTYQNNTECHMSATINSWNPQNGETYTFVNDVTFSNPDDDTAPTFTIAAGTAVTMN